MAFPKHFNRGRTGNYRTDSIFDVLSALWSELFGNLILAGGGGKFQSIKMIFLCKVDMLLL